MLQNKIFTKILAVVIALSLWAYVISEVNPTTTKKLENIPVNLLNTENLKNKGLIPLDDGALKVSLVIEGKRADILNMKQESLIVTADLFDYGAGENYVGVNVEAPEGITVKDIRPGKIRVMIDQLVSERKPVRVSYETPTGSAAELGQMTVNPENIQVTGPRTLVDKVAYLDAPVQFDSFQKELTEISAEAVPCTSRGEPVPGLSLSARSVEIAARRMTVKTVPLIIPVTGEEDVRLQGGSVSIPDRISIRGAGKEVESVASVSAQPVDLTRYRVTTDIPVRLNLPEGVELAGSSEKPVVRLTVRGYVTKEFSLGSETIKIYGAEESAHRVELEETTIRVVVAARESVLDTIAESNIYLIVDVTGLEPGTYRLPIKADSVIGNGSGNGNIIIEPEQITVTISEE